MFLFAQDLRQVKVYDVEDELSESEDEAATGAVLEAEEDEEGYPEEEEDEYLDLSNHETTLSYLIL